jgi:plasmid stability protein
MRTTLTVDDDLAAELRRRARETGRSFKDIVNEALRNGLMPRQSTGGVEVPVRALGMQPGVDLLRARHLAADLEDEETLRKLELRK